VQDLKQDIALLNPTFFASVPRLYNKFYYAIKEQVSKMPSYMQAIFNYGYSKKLQFYRQSNGVVTKFIFDRLVFRKTKALLGTSCVLGASTSAPLSAEVLEFLKIVLCVPIQEGYGSTESSGCTFFTLREDSRCGHVGGVQKHMEFKLVDVPEMNYLATDLDEMGNSAPRGEICVRGGGVFAGYFNNPTLTKEAIDEEGWLHMGDVGTLHPHTNALQIIDRKKNIFKLSQGEYIAPERIEIICAKLPGIDEIFIYGDSLKSDLVAIVVVNHGYLLKLAESNPELKACGSDFAVLCGHAAANKHYLAALTAQSKADGLFGFETVKRVHLEAQPFASFDLITTTFKLKRNIAKQHYQPVIDELYAQIGEY